MSLVMLVTIETIFLFLAIMENESILWNSLQSAVTEAASLSLFTVNTFSLLLEYNLAVSLCVLYYIQGSTENQH